MIDGGWDYIAPAYAVTVLVLLGLAGRAFLLLRHAARRARAEEEKHK